MVRNEIHACEGMGAPGKGAGSGRAWEIPGSVSGPPPPPCPPALLPRPATPRTGTSRIWRWQSQGFVWHIPHLDFVFAPAVEDAHQHGLLLRDHGVRGELHRDRVGCCGMCGCCATRRGNAVAGGGDKRGAVQGLPSRLLRRTFDPIHFAKLLCSVQIREFRFILVVLVRPPRGHIARAPHVASDRCPPRRTP